MKKHEVTQTEFAKLIGVSQARVSLLCTQGKLKGATRKVGVRLMIDVEKGKAILRSTIDQGYRGKIKNTIGTGEKETPAASSGPPEKRGMDYNTARTLNEQYKAAIRKLEYEEKTGKLIDAQVVKETYFGICRQVRDSLLNITDRIASILAAEPDETKVRTVLNKEIRTALEALSKEGI